VNSGVLVKFLFLKCLTISITITGRNILKVLIHNLNEQDFSQLEITENNYEVIDANIASAPCVGCYNCWLKTPGTCKINDSLKNSGSLLGQSEETVLISKNCYGGYSERVKKILDRSISASLPFFTYRSWKMRHTRRYRIDRKYLTVNLYGDFLESETKTAELIVEANRSNMGFKEASLHIINQINEIGRFLK
jgi:multimeric flavodoxin WrbA